MTNLEMLLVGVALGAVPTSELSRILVAFIGQRLGVKPSEIRDYNDPDGGEDGN